MQVDEAIRSLVERGFAVLPGLYPVGKVERIRSRFAALHAELGSPPLYSQEPQWLSDKVEVSGTGLVLHKILRFYPELHVDLLEPDVVTVLRGALGGGMRLEFAGGVIADHTRPFFKWHNHVGGIEDEKFRRLGLRPPIQRPERVAMVLYLDAMGPDTGQLLIHPERVSGATESPGPVEALSWDGQLAVEGPPGTVVLLDQTAWHAALPRTCDQELRCFVGLWFVGDHAPAADRIDESLFDVETDDPLLRSVLPQRTELDDAEARGLV